MANKNNVKYTEPADYIPKSVRKELKLGEFAEEEKKKGNRTLEDAFRDYEKKNK